MKPVAVTVRQPTSATPQQAYDAIVPVTLEDIFLGYGPLPAVVGTRDQVGDWDAAGDSRTVILKDGNTLGEELVRVESPGRFEYRVVPQSGPLARIVDHIDGRFLFEAASDGEGSVIDWTYAFVAKPGRRLLLLPLAPLWRRYATATMRRGGALADRAALSNR